MSCSHLAVSSPVHPVHDERGRHHTELASPTIRHTSLPSPHQPLPRTNKQRLLTYYTLYRPTAQAHNVQSACYDPSFSNLYSLCTGFCLTPYPLTILPLPNIHHHVPYGTPLPFRPPSCLLSFSYKAPTRSIQSERFYTPW